MELTTGGVTSSYYFQRNLQGDVVAIYNKNGALKAKYLYDAWDNCTISGETTSYDVANANPIRYRGYYYDSDTGLYYCNARYYSPKWRRFISPDDTAYLDPESVNGLNLYCYCNNDPVNYADPSGHFVLSTFLICLGVGVAIGGALGGYTAYTNDQDVLTGIFTGALLGAAVGAVVGIGGAALSGAMSSVLSKTTTDLMSVLFYGGEFGTWEDYAIAFAFGGLGGSLGSVTGRLSGVAKGAKFVSDVAIRPLTNQLIKSGTRGRSFNAEKYMYDVVTRALTNGGSHSIMRGNIFGMNLKVDFGKSFYRATFRSLYSYI